MIVNRGSTLANMTEQANSQRDSQSPAKRQATVTDALTPPNRVHYRKKSVGHQHQSAKAPSFDTRSKQTTESRVFKVEERAQRIYKYNDSSVRRQADQIRKMELNSSGLL